MIALLRGVLLEKHPNQVIVETGGVGYDVTIPVSTFTHLPNPGAEVRLRIHTHVREDTLALYGFLTEDEKGLFEKLIIVSGIGPTLAVKILSGMTAPELVRGIRRGEVERLVRIPGVGKKTAERMCSSCATNFPPSRARNPRWRPRRFRRSIRMCFRRCSIWAALARRPKAPCAKQKPPARPPNSSRSSAALSNWYGKLVANAGPPRDLWGSSAGGSAIRSGASAASSRRVHRPEQAEAKPVHRHRSCPHARRGDGPRAPLR